MPNTTLIYKGGDGKDDFSGGPGSDRFEGGLRDDRVLYLDSRGIRIAEEFNAENDLETRIYDGMGHGGVDTVDSIRDIYASTGDDYVELYSNPDQIERVILSAGNDTVIGNLMVGYWNLFNSPEDPRYADEWHGGVQSGVTDASVNVNISQNTVSKKLKAEFMKAYTLIH